MRVDVEFAAPAPPDAVAEAVAQALSATSPRFERFAACVRLYYRPRGEGDFGFLETYFFVKTAVGDAVVVVDWRGRPVATAQPPSALAAAVSKVFEHSERQRSGEKPEKVEVFEVPEELAFEWYETVEP